MHRRTAFSVHQVVSFAILTILVFLALWLPRKTQAALPLPPNPQQGSVGIEGTIPSPAPTQAATITVPVNGQTFTSTPITVSGLCPKDLLVKIFSNNVFVGSAQCANGSYTIQVDIFSGRNDLVARVYDALDQAGPDSTTVTITFNDAQFSQFGGHMSITSDYAKRGANPGERLDWPMIVGGGTGSYAVSVEWGDNKQSDLISLTDSGGFTVSHIYDAAGVYNVVVRGTDKNGTGGFLQVVGVANGAVQQVPGAQASSSTQTQQGTVNAWKAVGISAGVSVPLLVGSFLIGQKYELFSLRRHLERSAANLEDN